MSNDDSDVAVVLPGVPLDHIVDGKYVRKILKEYEPSISSEVLVPNADSRVAGKKWTVPHYCAGFFMDGRWFHDVYLPRRNMRNGQYVLWALDADPDVNKLIHKTTRFILYMDSGNGCVFMNLCHNHKMFRREPWFSRRYEVLEAVCKSMQFTEQEMAQARTAFRWHMIGPICWEVVPREFIVGI